MLALRADASSGTSVAALMGWVVALAVTLALLRAAGDRAGVVVGGWLVALVGLTGFFVSSPYFVRGMVGRGEFARAAWWLRVVVAVPSPVGRSVKRGPLMVLAVLERRLGRDRDAVDAARRLLSGPPQRGLVQIKVRDEAAWRGRLAAWLDELGRHDEADAERTRAGSILHTSPGGTS